VVDHGIDNEVVEEYSNPMSVGGATGDPPTTNDQQENIEKKPKKPKKAKKTPKDKKKDRAKKELGDEFENPMKSTSPTFDVETSVTGEGGSKWAQKKVKKTRMGTGFADNPLADLEPDSV
jgi:hypothetical protein